MRWSLQSARFLAEIIRSETVHAGPQDAARRVEQQEGKPGHAIGPGEQGGKRAEQRDEATEEHDLAAMTPKQILPDLDLALGQADVVTVAQQERIADLPPDPEPDDAADDRARRGSHDHQSNIEVVRRARVDGREDQGGLARNRNADAFEADDRGDRPIAVDREQVRRRYGKEQTDLAILLDVRTAITQRSSRARFRNSGAIVDPGIGSPGSQLGDAVPSCSRAMAPLSMHDEAVASAPELWS